MTPDADALLSELRTRRSGGLARTLAVSLGWRRPGAEPERRNFRRSSAVWDAYRVDRAADALIAVDLAEAVHGRAGTRYRARR